MRALIAVMALALAACDGGAITSDGDLAGGPDDVSGYTMEIRAAQAEQTFLIRSPEGQVVAARAAGGASMLMDEAAIQSLAVVDQPGEAATEVMSLRVPGFSMNIGANGEDENGENGQVNINIGAGKQRVTVNADEGGPGEADDRAFVRITGADEEAVRKFIAEQDELLPATQAEMLAALGL